jgi:hypothetical protein
MPEMMEALDAAAPLVAADGLLVLEHAKRDAAPPSAGALVKTRDIVSGDSGLAFYEKLPRPNSESSTAKRES